MHFAGRLHLHDDPGPGLAVDLQIDEGTLSLTSGAEGLGTWNAGEVTATRITGDRFAMNLAGEEVVFVANDPLGFTYEGLPSIEDAQNQRKPGMLSRFWSSRRSERATESERGMAAAQLASTPPAAAALPTQATGAPQTAVRELPIPTPEIAVSAAQVPVPRQRVAAGGEPVPAQAEQAAAPVPRPGVIEIAPASGSQPASPQATRQPAAPVSPPAADASARREPAAPHRPDHTTPATLSADPWARPDPPQPEPQPAATPVADVPAGAVPRTAGVQPTAPRAATLKTAPATQPPQAAASVVSERGAGQASYPSAPAAPASAAPERAAAPSGAAARTRSKAGLVSDRAAQKPTSPASVRASTTPSPVTRTVAQPSQQPQEERRCPAVRTDGRPCQSTILGPSGYCFSHDPELDEERREARRRGGLSTGRLTRLLRVPPAALAELYERLERAIVEVHEGALEPARATAMASLVQALCATLELGDARRRLEDLAAGLHDSSGEHEER